MPFDLLKAMILFSCKNSFMVVVLMALCALLRVGSAARAEGQPGVEVPKQVLMEVLIADIAHDSEFDFGVAHEFVDSGKGSVSLFNDESRVDEDEPEYYTRRQTGDLGSVVARFPAAERADQLFQGLDIVGRVLDVHAGELFAAIQALEAAGKGEILSRPHVIALDGQEAQIQAGQKVPFLTRQVTAQKEIFVSADTPTGITLTVTPTIFKSDEGHYFVQMKVNPQVSFVSRQREERGIYLPVTASREASTTVLVASGKTFILGGLFRDSETRVKRGVPGLMKMPVLGGLFSKTSRDKVKSELVISITPTVLDPSLPLGRREELFMPQEKQIQEQMEMKMIRARAEAQGKNEKTSEVQVEEVTSEVVPQ